MDRTFVYPGAVPQDTDVLQPQRNMMEAIGFALQATFGVDTVVDGLTCTQSPSPNMYVVVSPGSIIQNSVVDQNSYGSLPADSTDALVKMGINSSSTTLGAFTAPTQSGYSQNFLIEAELLESDGAPVVLPYYNPTNPNSPYTGPNNSSTAQNTKRTQTVNLVIKDGSPAITGTQTTPAPDTGYVGLWVVTIANGDTQILNSMISVYPGAPFINGTGQTNTRGIQPGRLLNVQSFITDATYTPTPGTNTVIVEGWGGGGAGGGSAATSTGFTEGGGGASGSYFRTLLTNAQSLAGTTITIGLGGTGVAGANGNAGGATNFGVGLSAPGGLGGSVGNYASTGAVAFGGNPGAAGTGGSIDNFAGATGGFGIVVGSGSGSLYGTSGAGANSAVGSGGAPVIGTTAGNAGSGHASGGGGASTNAAISTAAQAGGAGARGLVRVWEYT